MLLSEMASYIEGRSKESELLREQAERTKMSMVARIYDEKEGMWRDGLHTEKATFHSQHYALTFGLTPSSGLRKTYDYIKRRGMVGSTYSAFSLLTGLYSLSNIDGGELANVLLLSCEEHSWCNMLRGGATTTWEVSVSESRSDEQRKRTIGGSASASDTSLHNVLACQLRCCY